jgi:hypothetical protein
MLRTDPTDPIDRSELVDPIDSRELREAMLHRDVSGNEVLMRPCCQYRWHDGQPMDVTRQSLFDDYDTTIVSTVHPQYGWTDPALVAIERSQRGIVVTAFNPGHKRPTEAENRRANHQLHDVLLATGLEVWRADGRAPDGSFLEEGWIVWGLPVEAGLAVAAQFGQFAIYEYDEAGMRVTIACPD